MPDESKNNFGQEGGLGSKPEQSEPEHPSNDSGKDLDQEGGLGSKPEQSEPEHPSNDSGKDLDQEGGLGSKPEESAPEHPWKDSGVGSLSTAGNSPYSDLEEDTKKSSENTPFHDQKPLKAVMIMDESTINIMDGFFIKLIDDFKNCKIRRIIIRVIFVIPLIFLIWLFTVVQLYNVIFDFDIWEPISKWFDSNTTPTK